MDEGYTDDDEVNKRVQHVWGDCCFDLDILRSRGGERKTQAEFMRDWLWSGCSWKASKARLDTLYTCQIDRGEKRDVSPSFKERAMKRLRDTIEMEQRTRGTLTTEETR